MLDILAEMKALAAELRELTDRPVVTDPRNTQPAPCALVELPSFDTTDPAVLCGEMTLSFNVIVIGPGNGSLAQDSAMLTLAAQLMAHPQFVQAQPVSYVPYGTSGALPPVPAYRLQIQKFGG